MFTLTLSLTGEVWNTDEPEEVLNDYPLMTLRDSDTRELFDRDHYSSINDFLRESSTRFDIVYDPYELSFRYQITDYCQALSLINSKYLNKMKGVFALALLLKNRDLIDEIVNGCIWNGSMSIFPDILPGSDIIKKIVSYSLWDGNMSKFRLESYKDQHEIVESIIKSPNWCGNCNVFTHYKFRKYKIIKLVLDSPKWNGCAKAFNFNHIKDISLIRRVFNDERWDGFTTYRLYSNIKVAREIVKSPLWDCNYALLNLSNEDVCEDREIYRYVINHPNWDGYSRFSGSFMKDKDFLREIITSERWNGCYFNFYHLNDKEFVREILDSPRWNGSLKYISSVLLRDKDFLSELMNHPRWDGDYEFDKILMSDKVFVRNLINHRKWDGSCKNIRTILLQDKEFLKEIINHSNWNRSLDEIKTNINFVKRFLNKNEMKT